MSPPQTTAQPAAKDVKKESAAARLLGSGMCALFLSGSAIEIY